MLNAESGGEPFFKQALDDSGSLSWSDGAQPGMIRLYRVLRPALVRRAGPLVFRD